MRREEFIITELSKSKSMDDLQNALFSLFTTPLKFSEKDENAKTFEEFILGTEDER